MSGHSRGSHLPALDGWRGVAILLVICCHVRWPWAPAQFLAPYGALGVHVFFALSGFLITTRLLEEHERSGGVSWRNFYIRRIFRILPPAIVCLAVLALLGFGLHLIPINGRQWTASLFFYRNYAILPSELSWYTGHFWSLAVEEHFYLLWPLMLWIFGVRRGAVIATTCALVIAIWRGLDERFAWVATAHPLLRGEPGRSDYRLDGMFWGCAAAYAWAAPRGRLLITRYAGTMAALAVVALIGACLVWTPPGHVALVAVLMALLPLASLGNPGSWAGRLLESEPLAWTGRISYSLYLWQQLFLPHASVPVLLPAVQTLPFNIGLAFLAAWLSYRYVEQPAMGAGKALQQRRRRERVAVAPALASAQRM
jgi:peptidoglycan/LPS O-acetylase OafA/YrhL